jgi:hypothetical protein
MIDVETLGVKHSRVPMFQIGWCVFNRTKILNQGLIHLNLLDVILKTGFMPDPDTVKWWQKQKYDPHHNDVRHLWGGLADLSAVWTQYSPKRVWANSPAFDMEVIKNHLHAIGEEPFWRHNQEMDYRTTRKLSIDLGWVEVEEDIGNNHNAMDDAVNQTRHLMGLLDAADMNYK